MANNRRGDDDGGGSGCGGAVCPAAVPQPDVGVHGDVTGLQLGQNPHTGGTVSVSPAPSPHLSGGTVPDASSAASPAPKLEGSNCPNL